MKKKTKHFRHGDVMLIAVNGIPQGAAEKAGRTLAEGEATGHAHRVDTGVLFEKDGKLYLNVEAAKATLSHEEHGPIDLEKGAYEVVIQKEYTPQAWHNVAD